MARSYTTHLCTFMGCEDNISILIQYVEMALTTGSVDNDWMIDLTRPIHDHRYIYNEYERLNKQFPDKVHIINYDNRELELRDPVGIRTGIGSWKVFYQFLLRFSDTDIIAKCDDDTCFIDVDTLAAAYEFRWLNKEPYLIHANCINNGITTFHQHRKHMWSDSESKIYPTGGLTGPLFSNPDIACDHHQQFCNDIIQSPRNIEKYKLNQNIPFTNRISINFIFMLGSDREELSKIDLQDEYQSSCKIPQRLGRCNLILGDFIVSHHAFGVQKQVMDRRGTYDGYVKLAKMYRHQSSTGMDVTPDDKIYTTLTTHDNKFVMMHPATKNTYKIKDVITGKYIGLTNSKKNNLHVSSLALVDDINLASLLDVKLKQATTIEFNNSNMLIRSCAENNDRDRIKSHIIDKFFQGGYRTELTSFQKVGDYYKIISNSKPSHSLILTEPEWSSRTETLYEMISLKHKENKILIGDIHLSNDDCINDGTYYTIGGERIYKPRAYTWMVDHYIWALVPVSENIFNIMLVADNLSHKYLVRNGDSIIMSESIKDQWEVHDTSLRHRDSKDWLCTREENLVMRKKPINKININISQS